jgi:1-acyl-sn-glycerol-3-phosphate acyltransferase
VRHVVFWNLMKFVVLGPILRLFFRPKVTGLENIPKEGPAILAPNHQSFADDVLVPLMLRKRRITILAKSDYWDHWWTRWFFKWSGCVPVRREGGSASMAAIKAAVAALNAGGLVMLFPEGTRSPDGRLYRGKTGVARIALEARVPVIPVGVVGTFELWPYDRKMPKAGRTQIRFGQPLRFDRYYETPTDRFILRSVTDEIMYEIMMLTGQEYVDEYGDRVKKEIEAHKAEARAGGETEGGGSGDSTAEGPAEPLTADAVVRVPDAEDAPAGDGPSTA